MTGNFGTGKSNAALVIQKLFMDDENRVTKWFEDNRNVIVNADTLRETLFQARKEELDDGKTALLIVDGMGAEYYPLLLNMAKQTGIKIECASIVTVKLPTSTEFNYIQWEDSRRLQEVRNVDNTSHNGASAHEKCTYDENLADVFSTFQIDMEDGFVNVGGNRVDGEAGIIFLGNIDVNDMDAGKDMFRELPDIFRDSALLQRVHGIVPGKQIPALSPEMYMDGWALNTEYFTEIMHQLRSPAETMRYQALAKELVEVSGTEISGREQEAVLKLCTAYMKLFFPHANKELIHDMKFKREFDRYCFQPAKEMQYTVLQQLRIINPNEFSGKQFASYSVRYDL